MKPQIFTDETDQTYIRVLICIIVPISGFIY